jgi:uncharacterized protein involved in copper resistance
VKILRIWLLVLLAVLLPVRGAVAAAMLCPPAGTGTQTELRLHDHASGHALMDAAEHQYADHDHGSGVHSHHDGSSATTDRCNLCSAFCSVTPLMSSPPTLPLPQEPAAIRFPDFTVPAPSFISDGQERPPRSI